MKKPNLRAMRLFIYGRTKRKVTMKNVRQKVRYVLVQKILFWQGINTFCPSLFSASVPPPPQAPAQPPPPPSPSKAPPQKTSTRPKTAERGALLSSICDFKKGGLKKTETNDKSKPRI